MDSSGLGVLESGTLVDASQLLDVAEAWKKLAKLADKSNPKTQYKLLLKLIITTSENELLHTFIKGSAIQTIGTALAEVGAADIRP